MVNSGTGNEFPNSDFLQVLLMLKRNVMESLNVAEVCRIDSEETAMILSSGETIQYSSLQGLDLQNNDVALIVFTDTDFRSNLKRIKEGLEIQPTETKSFHTRNCGVAIGLIYRNQGGE